MANTANTVNTTKIENMDNPVVASEPILLPLLALRGIVAFPGAPVKLELNLPEDLQTVADTQGYGMRAVLVALKDPEKSPPYELTDFFPMGCTATLSNIEKRGKALRVTASGSKRTTLRELVAGGQYGKVYEIESENDLILGKRAAAAYKEMLTLMDTMLSILPSTTPELREALLKSPTPGALADSIAVTLIMGFEHKQQVLDESNVGRRIIVANEAMRTEIPLIREDLLIHGKVREALEENQKE